MFVLYCNHRNQLHRSLHGAILVFCSYSTAAKFLEERSWLLRKWSIRPLDPSDWAHEKIRRGLDRFFRECHLPAKAA